MPTTKTSREVEVYDETMPGMSERDARIICCMVQAPGLARGYCLGSS
jgi:hypothetical protein